MCHPETDKQWVRSNRCSLFMLHFIVLYHFTLSYSFNTRVSITTAERYELCIYMYGVEEEEQEKDDLCDLSLLLRVSREVNSIIYKFAINLPCLVCCPFANAFFPPHSSHTFWQLSLRSPVLPLLAHLETLLPASLLCYYPSLSHTDYI